MEYIKNNYQNIFGKVITFASVSYFIYFLITNINFFNDLFKFSLLYVFIILFLNFLNILFMSNINLFILKSINVKLNFYQSLEVSVKNSLGNITTPFKLGVVYKISYLKKFFNLKLPDFIYANTIFSFINLLPALIFLITYFLLNKSISLEYKNHYLLIFLVFILFIILFFKTKQFKFLFKKSKKVNLKSINSFYVQINNLLYFINSSFIVWLIILGINENYLFFSAITYNSINTAVSIVTLTPGNIGIKEASISFLNNLHGLDIYLIILISFIERFLSLISLIIFDMILNKRNN